MEKESEIRKYVEMEGGVHGRTKKATVDLDSNMKEVVNVVLEDFLDNLEKNPEKTATAFYKVRDRIQSKKLTQNDSEKVKVGNEQGVDQDPS